MGFHLIRRTTAGLSVGPFHGRLSWDDLLQNAWWALILFCFCSMYTKSSDGCPHHLAIQVFSLYSSHFTLHLNLSQLLIFYNKSYDPFHSNLSFDISGTKSASLKLTTTLGSISPYHNTTPLRTPYTVIAHPKSLALNKLGNVSG